jgi:RNA polymerase sigma-70 factor (ECF subfamily)
MAVVSSTPMAPHSGNEVPPPAGGRPEASRPQEAPPGREVTTPDQDLELVRRFLERSPEAIATVGERLKAIPRILRVFNARSGHPLDDHALADVVQDAGLVLLQKLERFDGRVTLEGWMYGICRFEFLNASRKARRRPRPMEDVQFEEIADSVEATLDLAKIGSDIEAGLGVLPQAELAVVRAKHFEDLSFEAIGDRLGCSPNTAKTRYYRALRRLQAFMEPRKGEYEA